MPKGRKRPKVAAESRASRRTERGASRPLTLTMVGFLDPGLDAVVTARGWSKSQTAASVGMGDMWEWPPSAPPGYVQDDDDSLDFEGQPTTISVHEGPTFSVEPASISDYSSPHRRTYDNREDLIADLDWIESWRWTDVSPPPRP